MRTNRSQASAKDEKSHAAHHQSAEHASRRVADRHVHSSEGLPVGTLSRFQRFVGNERTAPIARQAEHVALLSTPATAPVPMVAQLGQPGRIQRHASWEHKMLGDVDPDVLEVIASGRDVAAEQQKRNSFWTKTQKSAKTIRNDKGEEISLENVHHAIDQEICRLQYFRTSPPTGTVAQATAALQEADKNDRVGQVDSRQSYAKRKAAVKQIVDTKWDVRLVEVPLSDGTKFLITYGELNTLADFYGSRDEMSQTPAANFRGILAGVREESLRKFMRLRNELTVSDKKPYKPDSSEHAFAGGIGNKGESAPKKFVGFLDGDQWGELKLMGKLGNEERAKIGDREETSYMAGLARNACHFAPYSWHAWGSAHVKAEGLAKRAGELRKKSEKLKLQNRDIEAHMGASEGRTKAIQYNQSLIDNLESEAAALQNEALLENGFADHYLQDSYAAGHLIDKTRIMQWFAQWLDQHSGKRDYSTEEHWRRIQQMAYGQDTITGSDKYDVSTVGQQQSNDPQSVENLGGTWQDRFAAAGLQIPRSLTDPSKDVFKLFTWWQGQAMNGNLLKAEPKHLVGGPINNVKRVRALLRHLVDDGVVYYNWYSTSDRGKGADEIGIQNKTFRIKESYIPKDKVKFRAAMIDLHDNNLSGPARYAKYENMAKAATYGDYHNFVNHGYLQLATNVLHDHFCSKGLNVAMKSGDTPYRIYGDNAMLGKESATMVKYSSQTSHMSRDSIYELAQTGQTQYSTASIAERFPTYIRPAGADGNYSIENWHADNGPLYKLCFNKIFDEVAAFFSKSTAVADGTLATKVSKDADVHTGESF